MSDARTCAQPFQFGSVHITRGVIMWDGGGGTSTWLVRINLIKALSVSLTELSATLDEYSVAYMSYLTKIGASRI